MLPVYNGVPATHYKLRAQCRATESRLGLTPTAKADKTAAPAPKRAEMEKAVRSGLATRADHKAVPATISAELRARVQTAAAGAGTTEEFFARLRDLGVEVGVRMSTLNEGQATGYKVRIPGYHHEGDPGVWYSGGKLAADLSLPRPEARWASPQAAPQAAPQPVGPGGEADAFKAVARATGTAAGHIADPAMPRATAEVLNLTAKAVEREPGPISDAARRFDRSYREPGGATPAAGRHATDLRSAAMTLAKAGDLGADPDQATVMELLEGITTLLEATAQLRDAQQRGAQAQAARQAAGTLHAEVTRLRAVEAPPGPGREMEHVPATAPEVTPAQAASGPVVAGPSPGNPATMAPTDQVTIREQADQADRAAAAAYLDRAAHHRDRQAWFIAGQGEAINEDNAGLLAYRDDVRTIDTGPGLLGRRAERVAQAEARRDGFAARWPERQLPRADWTDDQVCRAATDFVTQAVGQHVTYHRMHATAAEDAAKGLLDRVAAREGAAVSKALTAPDFPSTRPPAAQVREPAVEPDPEAERIARRAGRSFPHGQNPVAPGSSGRSPQTPHPELPTRTLEQGPELEM
jgi:hypothetical protein